MFEVKIEEKVQSLVNKAEKAANADEALKFSQAACNAANALRVLTEVAHWKAPKD